MLKIQKMVFRPVLVQRKTNRDRFKALFLCSNDYFDNAIYRRLKELGKISSYAENLHRWILYRSRTADLVTPLISGIECTTIVKDEEDDWIPATDRSSKEYLILNSDKGHPHFTFQKGGLVR